MRDGTAADLVLGYRDHTAVSTSACSQSEVNLVLITSLVAMEAIQLHS